MISRPSRLRLAALVALLASSLLHVAAMAISPEFGQETLVEGGDGETEAVLGSDFADLIKAGDRLDPVEPEATAIASPPPVTPPTPRTPVTQPVASPPQATVPATVPVPNAPSPSLYKLEPTQDDGPVAPSAAKRLEAVVPETPAAEPRREQPHRITPTKTEPREPDQIKPLKPAETITPVEEPKPVAVPLPKPKPAQKSPKQDKPRTKSSAGSETSRSQVNNKAGSRDGKSSASATSSGKSKSKPTSANSGNAAAANYPGKVYTKIARTRQRNAGGKGVAHVSFHVTASGQAVSVTVSRSSGNARVDKAAIDHVRRAAPFAAPPVGARTRFVIPIEFRR
ncbi:TonB family protein [Hoeflea alexandrii]|uniref:TonB family protein n=1 Tax=Hoeflea alexandrii TaxID=288436 RepID=UPI0022AFF3D7|nr:TonB family protein [Hoeflea alexandrii]MCZ4287384.1 TonB family protein [Hoeflea alexandrii]